MTYQEAEALMQRSRSGRVKLAHETYLQKDDKGNFVIKYWYTNVVEILKDGFYRLSSGGYQTHTTKKRINTYAPVNVFQRNWDWFLGGGIPFEDGILVDSDGLPVNGNQPA